MTSHQHRDLKNRNVDKKKMLEKKSLLTTVMTPSYELSSLFEADAITSDACPALRVTIT